MATNFVERQLNRQHYEIEKTTRKLELGKRRLTKINDDLHKARREYDDYYQVKPSQDEAERAFTQLRKVRNALFCPSGEKFHTLVFKGARNTSEPL
jgi:hypothetical protein